MKKKILVIAAHTDDEALGCGGTLLKYQKLGYEINSLFFTDGVSSRQKTKKKEISDRLKNAKKVSKKYSFKYFYEKLKDNQLDDYPLLSIIKIIEKHIIKIDPELIFTHSATDLNIDHQKIFEAVLVALRPQKKSNFKKLLSFEIPCSTHWNFEKSFQPNVFINIEEFINEKIKMISEYDKEIKQSPNARSYENIKNLAKFRGNTCNLNYAEAFRLVFQII